MNYLTKNAHTLHFSDALSWNFPEQKQGNLAILGGNSASFATEVKIATFATQKFSFLNSVINIFPDAVKKHLPPLPNLCFAPSNASGSFAKSPELTHLFSKTLPEKLEKPVDFALFLGDFSKNSETAVAISNLLINSPDIPVVLTRDGIDLTLQETENFVNRKNLTLVASLAQLQKLFRALYYPKVLLLSMPLPAALETLHKFTLSYPLSLLTFHQDQIILANSGQIYTFPLDKSEYSPISLWSGELALKASVFQLFNPKKPLESLLAAIEY